MKHQIVMSIDDVKETIARRFGVESKDIHIMGDVEELETYVDLGPFYINGEIVEEKKGD